MTRKRGNIIILVILVLIAFGFGGYKIADGICQKRAEEKAAELAAREYYIKGNYSIQNRAFCGIAEEKYISYTEKYEWKLQVHINFYIKNTGKIITLGEVETFLETSENPDGTPRTWVDDETGTVKDFVDWFSENESKLEEYRTDLGRILMQYVRKHPECPYNGISTLTPEQIIELDKKYMDTDYELVFEW